MPHRNNCVNQAVIKPAALPLLLVVIIMCVLVLGGCKKSTFPKEETVEQTETAIVTETQADKNAQTDLDALFGPEQIDYTIDLPPEYIGNNQIETEYTILDPEEGVTLSQEEIDRMDLLCKTMEDVTGLSFLKSKYGTDKKVTIHIHQAIGSGSADDSRKSIDIDVTCLKNPDFVATIHELVHILQFANVYTGGFPFFTEGHAEFWTYKIAQHILDNHVEGLFEMIDLENQSLIWQEYIAGEGDVDVIYEHDLDYWMDRGCYFNFSDSWPAYVYGRLFFLYLEDVYGDVNAFLPIYARIPYAITGMDDSEGAGGRKYMDMEPLKKMMMAAYSDDVFTNFYPWLREHEELLTQYSE